MDRDDFPIGCKWHRRIAMYARGACQKLGFPMIQAPQDNGQLKPVPPTVPATLTEAGDADNVNVSQRLRRFARLVRRYPLPFSVIGLLLVSLIAWLVGWHGVSQWSLIVIILLGGVPLLWQTVRQVAHGEVGVDVI